MMGSATLAGAGLLTILFVLAAILSKRVSPLAALAAIPLLTTLILGQGPRAGEFMLDGMMTVAPMAALFLFAILFFGILSDAGLFRPIVSSVVRLSRDHPPYVAVGTAVLATIVQLDGSGAITFLVVVPAMVPVYDRIGLDRRLLACIVAMAAGVGNMLPWGGPTIRAATALQVPVMDLFGPLIPVWVIGTASVLILSWYLGHRQLSAIRVRECALAHQGVASPPSEDRVPLDGRYWFNLATVIVVLGTMLAEWLPPAVIFLIGTIVVLVVNFPGQADQREVIDRHAPAVITMLAILLAAGVFTGIMRGTGMLDALARGGASLLPPDSAAHLPAVVGFLSMPLSLLFDPDSFYFGVLPVLGGIAEASGGSALSVGQAAVLGQMTTGFPVSPLTPATFLLVGLAGIGLADHQRYTIPFLFLLSVIMTIAAMVLDLW